MLRLEETRTFDEAALTRLLARRIPKSGDAPRLAVGRIVDPRGRTLLARLRNDGDVEVVAMVAFATGQLKDPDAVAWLAETMTAITADPAIAREAARSLGKIRTPEARAALAHYLTTAPATPAAAPIVGEALLADRPIHDARRSRARRALGRVDGRRRAVAGGLGVVSAARSGGISAPPATQPRRVGRGALLGGARAGGPAGQRRQHWLRSASARRPVG